MCETKFITLSSGQSATVRTPATGRDLINAYRLLPRKSSGPSVSMALIAQLTEIDGKPVLFEDVCAMPLADINALLIAGGLAEDDENPPSPPPPSSPPSSDSASQ